jgi:shikimate kinase
MILTLLGMSGAGKTVWATKFAAHGFRVFDCDALIATKLQTIVGQIGATLEEIGRWMGFPHQADFRRREALYLACEMDILTDVITRATACVSTQTNCVIDTSGSVVYSDRALLQRLRQCSTVIYLRIPDTLHQQMLNTYLDHPRPLIWNGLFNQAPNESLHAAFSRCYPQLIHHRERLYEQYSDVVLEYGYHCQPTLTVERLLEYVRLQLSSLP